MSLDLKWLVIVGCLSLMACESSVVFPPEESRTKTPPVVSNEDDPEDMPDTIAPAQSALCISSLQESNWTVLYEGFGNVELDEATGFLLEPKTATEPDETHAALILSNFDKEDCPLQDFRLTVTAVTEAQLRATPNPWEVFWIFFNYQGDIDDKFTNYFILKTNGIELGRAFATEGQTFLETTEEPQLVVGNPNTYVLEKRGGKLDVWIDEVLVMSYESTDFPDALYDYPGLIGLYSEDARVRILSVLVESLSKF